MLVPTRREGETGSLPTTEGEIVVRLENARVSHVKIGIQASSTCAGGTRRAAGCGGW